MHVAKMLSLAVEAARTAGYEIREDILDGSGGGHCLIHGKKYLLLDMTQTHREQLSDVLDALRAESQLKMSDLHPLLAASLQESLEKAA